MKGTLHDPVRVMRKAIKFASRDARRPILCAVHLDESGDVVSTDSFRLYAEGAWDGPTIDVDYATAYDVSRCKIKGNDEAEVEYVGGKLVVRMGDGTEIIGAIQEGKYPNYKALLDGVNHKTVVYLPVKQAMPILKAHAKGNVRIDVCNRDVVISGASGEAEPACGFDKVCDGEDALIELNAKYLIDAINCVGTSAELRIEASHKPLVVADGDGVEVLVMPVRLGDTGSPKVKKGMKKAPRSAEPEIAEQVGSLKGERVCITGTLPGMTRSEAFTRLKLAGGVPCERFTSKVTLLVIAAYAGKSKRDKAESAIAKGQKVRVVNGTEFVKALNEQGKTAGERKMEEHMTKKESKKEGVNREGLAELLYALAIDRASQDPHNKLKEGNASPNSATYVWRLQKDGRLKHEDFGNFTSWYLDGDFVTCIERRYSKRKVELYYPEIKPAQHKEDEVMKRRTEQKLAEHGVKAEQKKEAPKVKAPKAPKKEDTLEKRIAELEAELKKRNAELDEVWKENERLKAAKQASKAPEPKAEPKPAPKSGEVAPAEISLAAMEKWCEGKGLIASQKREGCCIWVEGESKPYADELKEMGFRFAKKRKSWYLDPKQAA